MADFLSARDSSNHYWVYLAVTETANNPATNAHSGTWAFYIGGASGWWFAGWPANAAVAINGSTVWSIGATQNPPASASSWAGGYYLLASGTWSATGTPDGSFTMPVAASYETTDKNDYRPHSLMSISDVLPLPTLHVAPGTPTGLACAYVSDTSVNLSWTNNYATNGVPATNNIEVAINGAASAPLVSVAASGGASVSTAANRKSVFKVNAQNDTGTSAFSATATVYTTPAAPTGVTAAKNVSANIDIAWTPQVGFAEHQHVIEHSTDGGTTWSALATVASGTSTYTHTSPSAAVPHKYRVRAKNTDVGALASAWVVSNEVVLLTAPNKPTIPALNAYQDKAVAFVFPWVHNPVDSTAQTKYQLRYSTNGGSTWTTNAKTTSTTQSYTFAASTFTSGQAVMIQVRTKGLYDSGSDGDASYSPWSDAVAVTFKTHPTMTITGPANASTYGMSALTVVLGFSQPEAATFVSAVVELWNGGVLIESKPTTTLAGTLMATKVANGQSYTLKVIGTDSNGVASPQVTATFNVVYTAPVAAGVTVTYLPDSGIGQIGVTVGAPGGGQAAAVTIRIERTIDGSMEVVDQRGVAPSLTILDMTPTTYGTNTYTVTTVSADGAETDVTVDMVTSEVEWAFMNAGPGYVEVIRFGGELDPKASPTVDSALVKTSGRKRPIGMYGKNGSLVVAGTGEVVTGYGSSAADIEEFLKVPGKGCYRDPSGRRLFGQIKGDVSDARPIGTFTYTVTETS